MPDLTDNLTEPDLTDVSVVVLDGGMAQVRAQKQAHFEAFSGQQRTPADLDSITQAAYAVRANYDEAEALFRSWAYSPVPTERVASYILAEMGVDEAVEHWEPRFAGADGHATAALEMLVALRAPDHALLRR
jgi:hypothetical protein